MGIQTGAKRAAMSRLLLLFCVLALALAGPASDRGEEELDEYYDHVNDRNIWDYYGTGGRDGDENDDVEDRNIFEDYGEYDDEDEDEDVYDDDVYNRYILGDEDGDSAEDYY